MEYIKAEYFLKQTKQVQETFLSWWIPSVGDLYTYATEDTQDYSELSCITSLNVAKLTEKNKGVRIPLFTEGQLRKFIEDKTGAIVKVIQWHIEDSSLYKKGYSIDILSKDKYSVNYSYGDLGENLIKAYWEIACDLAKG